MFKNPNQQIHFCLHGNEYLIVGGAFIYVGAYNHNVTAVIKLGACIRVLIFYGYILSRFYSTGM